MKFVIAALAAVVATTSATDICLPDTHSAWVHQYKDEVRYDHRRPEEYRIGDHVHVWYCKTAQKSLVHVHLDDDHRRAPAKGMLRDYAAKRQWNWDWNNGTASNCVEGVLQGSQEPQCLAYKAKLAGNTTIGQDFAVDYYDHRVVDHEKHFEFDVSTLVEAGTTDKPAQQRVRGARAVNGQLMTFYERLEIFGLDSHPIAASTWDKPAGCP